MKGIKSNPVSGPRSSAGITSFAGISGGGGPQVSPKVIIGICIGFVLLELVLNFIL